MEKNMKILLAGFVCTAFLLGCKAQEKNAPQFKINADNNSLLWRVTGPGLKKPSFLFGTFHLLCKQDIHFSEQLKQSLSYADTVYMEMDMDDPSTLMGGLLFMNMKDGKSLKDLYSDADYSRIVAFFNDELHTPIQLFERMKPYMLVAMTYPKMMDCKTPSGVEEELMKLAKDNKKEILGLETIQFQASVFDSIPYEWQAKELLKAVDSFHLSKNEFDSMALVYKEQRTEEMANMLSKSDFGGGDYEDILLTRRNINWVGQLMEKMPVSSLFVAVGAGHLFGPNGLIVLLRQKGYTVEALVNR